MYYYAIINDNNNVIGLSQLSGPVSNLKMIPVDQYDPGLMHKKWDGTIFATDPAWEAEIAEQAAAAQAKEQAFVNNLPSWQAVSDAIDAADTLAKLRAIVKKMARVLYWLARNRED